MTPLIKILPVAAMTALAGCASFGDEAQKPRGIAQFAEDVRLGEEVQKVCFNRNIDGFGETTKDTVVLKKGVRDEYIVEVFGVCQDLKYANRIAIDSALSCVSRNDYLIVSDSVFGTDANGLDRCSIRKIHKWDSKAEEDAPEDETDPETGDDA